MDKDISSWATEHIVDKMGFLKETGLARLRLVSQFVCCVQARHSIVIVRIKLKSGRFFDVFEDLRILDYSESGVFNSLIQI